MEGPGAGIARRPLQPGPGAALHQGPLEAVPQAPEVQHRAPHGAQIGRAHV